MLKLYSDTRDLIETNSSILEWLRNKKVKKRSNRSDALLSFKSCTMQDFDLRLKKQLKAIATVRQHNDIYEGMKMNLAQRKGSVKNVLEGNAKCLLKLAFDMRKTDVKTNLPPSPDLIQPTRTVSTLTPQPTSQVRKALSQRCP